jgi:hypothetical protein
MANNPVRAIDLFGLYTTTGTILPDNVAGKTEFEPKITIQSVSVNHCCCSINQATWAANTVVLFPGSAAHPAYRVTTLEQILSHEIVHASSDDAVAAKALPIAIRYLQGVCVQKKWWYGLFTGWEWTEEQCKNEMQIQADAAASAIREMALDSLNTQAHGLIGAYPNTWNPAGLPVWDAWFSGWLAAHFNGGKYW